MHIQSQQKKDVAFSVWYIQDTFNQSSKIYINTKFLKFNLLTPKFGTKNVGLGSLTEVRASYKKISSSI
jgi:hypothetical protein